MNLAAILFAGTVGACCLEWLAAQIANRVKEHFEWLQKEYPDDELSMGLSMENDAISHDGKYTVSNRRSRGHDVRHHPIT